MTANSYHWRKLHSLLGVIPIGAFLIEHFVTNYFATKGNAVFVEKVEWLNNLPFLFFMELFLIWLPIAYHAIYGTYMAFQARHNVNNFGYFRNYMFFLQRVTGVITLVFIIWHTWETRVQLALGNVATTDLGILMRDILSNNLFFALYAIGIIAAVFHFANGMWSFLVAWGITVGPRAQKVSSYACGVLFIVMSIVGIMAISAFVDPEFMTKGAGNIG